MFSPGADMDVKDRIALVSGGGSGIGQAVAFELANRGAKTVVIVDRRDDVYRLADDINSQLGRQVIEPKVGDTTNDTFRAQVYDQVTARHGVVTICVPAAGITRDALAVAMDKNSGRANPYSITAFREVTEVNLIAPIFWAIDMVVRIAEDRWKRGLKQWQPETRGGSPRRRGVYRFGVVTRQQGADRLCRQQGRAGRRRSHAY
jgi:NAD(P)-dependent dehydrogenase (short-subunit alcohol dehydrogenase family)